MMLPDRRAMNTIRNRLAELKDAAGIQPHDLVPGVGRQLLGRATPAGAGIIDQHIDGSVTPHDCFDQRRGLAGAWQDHRPR